MARNPQRFLLSVAFCVFWLIGQKTQAASLEIRNGLNFGSFVAVAHGGRFTLNTITQNQPLGTGAVDGLIRISRGSLGRIRYVPGSQNEHILIHYQDVSLADGKVRIEDMGLHSTLEINVAMDEPPYEIVIGAVLVVGSGFSGLLEGSLPVSIVVINE